MILLGKRDSLQSILKKSSRFSCRETISRADLKSINERDTEDNPVKGWVAIMDMDGYDLSQFTSPPTLKLMLQLAPRVEKRCRDVDYGYILNMNFVAERFIQFVSPALGSALSRFEIEGTDKHKWIPKLLRHIPKASLPEWYGGPKDFKPLKVYG